MLRRLTYICLLLMGTLAMRGQADIDSIAMGVELQTVQVEGKPYREVIPAQVLGGAQLQRLTSHSVADALRYFSGVQIKDYGGVGGIKTVDMRSMGTNHLGVFYDGIQLGNAQNGQIDLGKFSLDNIESISMYNGQKSDIFQPAKDFGSAGTVYINTRRPTFVGDKRWNANVTMRTGSFGLANPSVRFDYKFSEAVTATVSAEYTYATGRYKFRYRKVFADGTLAWDTTAVRQNGDINAMRLEGAVYGRISRGYWQAKAYYYDSERGLPGAIVNNVWKTAQRQWDRSFFTQGRLNRNFSDTYSLQVNAKYARDYMRYLNPDTTLMYINNRFWQNEVYLSAANRVRLMRGWDANLSVDYQWNHLDATLVNFARPVRHSLMAALATAVTVGSFKAQASLLGTFVTDRRRATENRSNYRRLTPAVFASYDISRGLNVRAFYKRTFRMPTFNDLYYTDMGNASLRPEQATQYNIGASWHRDFMTTLFTSLKLTADAYINRVADKIIAVPKGTGQYRWMMMNIGKVHIRGIDLTANLNMEPLSGLLVGGRLTYTYQQAQDYSDPSDNDPQAGTYRGQIAYIPRNSGSATLNGSWRNAELNYSFIYVGERYHTSANIAANYEQPWYTHDLAASYRWQPPRTGISLRLTLEVNNLFNQQYEVIQNYPMPGRNYKVIVKFDF